MNELTSKQRAFLRKLAHSLKPVVHVGAEGVSPALIVSIADALKTRELLKVKVLERRARVGAAARRAVEEAPSTDIAITTSTSTSS